MAYALVYKLSILGHLHTYIPTIIATDVRKSHYTRARNLMRLSRAARYISHTLVHGYGVVVRLGSEISLHSVRLWNY